MASFDLARVAHPELWALFAALVIGLFQVVGGGERIATARENFNRSFPLFAAAVLAVAHFGAFGPWSMKGALVYAAARLLYLVLTLLNWTAPRMWVWALSIAGIVGCYAQLAKALLTT